MKESKVVTFIGGFYIFGGIVVLLSLIFSGSQLNVIFNLPNIPDYIVKLSVVILYIPLGYLYIRRIKIANWLIVILAIVFFCISADLTTSSNSQPYIGNMIYSLFVIITSIVRKNEFSNSIKTIRIELPKENSK